MKTDTPIKNISDKGIKPTWSKNLKYTVSLKHFDNDTDLPEVVAKFKNYGDCLIFASAVSKAPVHYHEIIIS